MRSSATHPLCQLIVAASMYVALTLPVQATDVSVTVDGGQTFTVASDPLDGVDGCDIETGGHSYATQDIVTGTAATYTMAALSAGTTIADPFLAIYSPSFDPDDPTANLVTCDDDRNTNYSDPNRVLPLFTVELAAGVPYVVVATSYDADPAMTGTLAFQIAPDLTDVPSVPNATSVPTLSPLGMIILAALVGWASFSHLRRRRV
jgi:hypothetical protein